MSIHFNGSTSKLVWSGQLFTAQPLSLFGWAKPTSAIANQMACGAGHLGGNESINCYFHAGTNFVRGYLVDTAGTSVTCNSTDGIVTTWQPWLLTWSGSSALMYYDGSGAGAGGDPSGLSLTFANLSRFVVGMLGSSDTFPFDGDVAEIACWSSALTSGNWTSLKGDQKPELIASGTLIEHWSLLDASTLAGDNGRTLTATSVTTGATHPITRGGGSAFYGRPYFDRSSNV